MIRHERTLLSSLGVAAAIAGCAVGIAGLVLALDILLDPTVLFGGSWQWLVYSQSHGGVLFNQGVQHTVEPMVATNAHTAEPMVATNSYVDFPAARWLLAVAAFAEAAAPAAVLLGAAGAARISLTGGLAPRLPRLAWMTACVVVLAVMLASVCQALVGFSVASALGIRDPLQLAWTFDAICAAVVLLLGISGLILRHGARLQRDAEGLV